MSPQDEIARRAGVAIGTLYNHFPARAELIDVAFMEAADGWVAIGEEALAAPDPWDGVVHFLVRSCELQSIDRGLREVCLGSILNVPGVEAAKARAFDLLTRVVRRAQAAGVLRADAEPNDLPMAIVAATGIAELDPAAWRRHITYFLDGLRTSPGG